MQDQPTAAQAPSPPDTSENVAEAEQSEAEQSEAAAPAVDAEPAATPPEDAKPAATATPPPDAGEDSAEEGGTLQPPVRGQLRLEYPPPVLVALLRQQ